MWEEYFSPTSVQEALKLLRSYKGEARIIAGGTDLVIELKEQTRKVRCLVDITGISALQKLELDGDNIKLGATVTHSQAASSELIQKQATVLAEAAASVGSPLTRNQGTVVGNFINAQLAADTAVALFALDAQAEVATSRSSRLVPIARLYQDIGVSRVDSTRGMVTALYFKCLKDNQGSAFYRLAQRKALALPMLNVAVVVATQDNHFEDVRIVVAPVALMPFRSSKAEAVLKGALISPESTAKAAEIAASEARSPGTAL